MMYQYLIILIGIKINVNKTKVCIFEKRKSVSPRAYMYINGEKIDIVDKYIPWYLL